MHSLRKTFIFVASFFVLSMAIFPAMAQIEPVNGGDFGLPGSGSGGVDEAKDIIKNVINIFLGFVGIIALIVLIYGGVLYITSLGDETRAATAKRVILYAIVGLLVVGLAAVAVNFVITAIGRGGSGSGGGGGVGGGAGGVFP